jgi:hypothetical protein
MGRFGNQIFQFASTLGIANRIGVDAKFPIENCMNYNESGPFNPMTGRCMAVKCDLLDAFEIDPTYFMPHRHLKNDNMYTEEDFGYNLKTESLTDNTSIYGYFQTEKYFSECRDLILSQLVFRSPYRTQASDYMENLRKDLKSLKTASIHVRRGDYLMFPDHHPPCAKEYYDRAVKEIKTLVGTDDLRFLVFSDDVEWCRTQFIGEEYIIVDMANPFSEMCLMSMCDHNIIANSSFSWWGAWLGNKEERIVIAPSRWFGHLIQKDTSDVYCKNWKVL